MLLGAAELLNDVEEEEREGLQGELRAEAKAGVWGEGKQARGQSVKWGELRLGRQVATRSQKALWASQEFKLDVAWSDLCFEGSMAATEGQIGEGQK